VSVSPSEPPITIEVEPVLYKNQQLVNREISTKFGVSAPLIQRAIPTWNIPGRPKDPKVGTFGFNMQTKNLEYWTGGNWLILPMRKI
jgi:hypothetical protein